MTKPYDPNDEITYVTQNSPFALAPPASTVSAAERIANELMAQNMLDVPVVVAAKVIAPFLSTSPVSDLREDLAKLIASRCAMKRRGKMAKSKTKRPRYQIGQVVALKNIKLYGRVARFDKRGYYVTELGFDMQEDELRPLTARERGSHAR